MTDQKILELRKLVSHTENKSEKVRILNSRGVAKRVIADVVQISLPHVQTVLSRSAAPSRPNQPSSALEPAAFSLELDPENRITLPAEYLERAALKPGDRLICRQGADEITIMSRAAAIRHLEALLKERLPDQAGLIEALLAERTGGKPGAGNT